MKTNHLTLKIFALIVLNDIIDTAAQLIMKKGLIYEDLLKNASSPLLWAGIAVFMLNFLVWIIILYKVDLSIAMPVGSTSYLFVPLAAVLFLREEISPVRWAGIICIVLGIHFVSRSKKTVKEGRAN